VATPPLPPVAPSAVAAPPPASMEAATSFATARTRPGFLSTLLGLYVAPVETFRAIAASPTFALPFLGIVLVTGAFTFVWLRNADPVEVSRVQLEETGVFDRFPPEQHAELVAWQARRFRTFAWLGVLVFAPIAFVALAAVFLFIYRFFYEAETTFRQSLAVVAWSLLAFYLVVTSLMLLVLKLRGDWNVDPHGVIQANAGALVEKGAVPKPLHALLDVFDLFSLWILFLLAAGYAATARRSVGSAAVGVLVLWGIYVLMKVALAAIF
jgi:energy-coupling factor transporter transmembrane protein EcfT